MKRTFIIESVACILCLMTACNNSQTTTDGGDKATPEREIVLNDKIQNTFFGVSFGATKDEVVSAFAEHDFYEDYYSTDSRLSFEKKTSQHGLKVERFSFGGLNWELLYVNLANNHFKSIEFANAFRTKESALKSFDNVLSAVSSKYQLYEEPIDDTSSYKRFVGIAKYGGQWVIVHCYSYESVGYQRWVSVTLAYGDNSIISVSDEL